MPAEPNGWRSKNALRRYPFQEDTNLGITLVAVQITTLANDVVEDLVISCPLRLGEDELTGVALAEIEVVPPLMTFTFQEQDLPFAEDIASVTVDIDTFDRETAYKLTAIRTGTHGVISFGKGLETLFSALGAGVFKTVPGGAFLEAKVVKNNPFIRVTSVSDIDDPGSPLVGDVKLEEGYNILLTRQDESNSILVSAVIGAGKGIFCGGPCEEPENCDDAVYTINGVVPGDDGNFRFSGQNFATVEEGVHKIIIGTTIDAGALCERSGTTGDTGPDGPDGPAGGGGGNAPKSCITCFTCEDDCDKPLKGGGGIGKKPGPGTGLALDEDPCA